MNRNREHTKVDVKHFDSKQFNKKACIKRRYKGLLYPLRGHRESLQHKPSWGTAPGCPTRLAWTKQRR